MDLTFHVVIFLDLTGGQLKVFNFESYKNAILDLNRREFFARQKDIIVIVFRVTTWEKWKLKKYLINYIVIHNFFILFLIHILIQNYESYNVNLYF